MMDKRLLALVPDAMRHVLATVFWQWVGLVGNVALIWGICEIITTLMALAPVTAPAVVAVAMVGDPTLSFALAAALAVFSLALRTLSTRGAARESFAASEDVKRTLRAKIYEKLLKMGPGYTEHVPTAEVVQLSVEGCEQLETYFGQYLPQLFYSVLAPVTLFCVVAPIHLGAAAVLLVCVPLIPLVIVAVQKVAKRILGKYWDQYAELGDSFLENLQGLTTLKIYQADAARHELMNEEAEHFRVVTMKVLSMQLNSIIVMDIVALGGAVAGITVALFAAASGAVTFFGCLFIILVSSDFFVPMRQLGSFFHVAMNGIAASEKIFRLLALPEPPARTLAPEAGDHFCLRNVTFGYEPGRTVLHNVSLDVASVGLTAIVGESGSGKSTVASLLAGRHDGYEGGVLLGAKQVRELDPAALAQYVTCVSLGDHLFCGTVRENLLMAAPAACDCELWDALEAANLADFLRASDGLDTQLTEGAANLSGGQRQRLSLARALLHASPVYVFDEATSNIDVESEESIMDTVRKLARDRAVVVISHRLANVVDAKRIYVLEQGRVVGEGTHDELLRNCAAYRALWERQQELEGFARGSGGAAGPGVTAGVAEKDAPGEKPAPKPAAPSDPTSTSASAKEAADGSQN